MRVPTLRDANGVMPGSSLRRGGAPHRWICNPAEFFFQRFFLFVALGMPKAYGVLL
jgi:hypothetical protein